MWLWRWLPLVGLLIAPSDASKTGFDIKDKADYKTQRACGQGCMWANSDWIGSALGCVTPWADNCLCRTALAPPDLELRDELYHTPLYRRR